VELREDLFLITGLVGSANVLTFDLNRGRLLDLGAFLPPHLLVEVVSEVILECDALPILYLASPSQ
jgi:hypothetical protein